MSDRIRLLLQFADEAALTAAAGRLATAGLGPARIYSPHPVACQETGGSPVPRIVLAAGLAGLIASLALQIYASARSYPVDIGGRPPNSWPAFLPTAFENGILAAVAGGFFGFLGSARLPDPAGEAELMPLIGAASRDAYFLLLPLAGDTARRRALAMLPALAPAAWRELPQ